MEYLLSVQTGQSSNLKTLFEVLKEVLLSDINLIFTKSCIKVAEIDGSQQTIVHLNLESSAFEYYFCEKDTYVGINTPVFYKIIKICNSSDNISLSILKKEPYILIIKFQNDNDNRVFESKLKLFDVDKKNMDIPRTEFPCFMSIPSSKFQKNMKDLNSLGVDCKVSITNVENELIFSCQSEYSENRVVFKQTSSEVNKRKDQDIIQGLFSLKFIVLFTKATSLCDTVNIYMKNDFPIILEYSVGVLGSLRFILSNVE